MKDYRTKIENGFLTIEYLGWKSSGGPWIFKNEGFSLGNTTEEQINAEVAYRVNKNRTGGSRE